MKTATRGTVTHDKAGASANSPGMTESLIGGPR
jgi:hypothetical protein